MNQWLPFIILSVPLLTALSMLFVKEHQQTMRTTINLGSAAINIGLIVILIAGVYQGQVFETRFPLLPDINLVFHADALSLMFVTLSGTLWFFTTIYAIGYFQNGKNRSRFFGFFSLCVFSTLGIALAGNLITFLIFYELLTLATYPLIMHKGNAASLHSGKVYLRYTMFGGAVLLIGVVWLKSIAGALDFSTTYDLLKIADNDTFSLTFIFILLIIGLGVKAAIFPLHSWLPRAMAAPAPVSSLLHAVAVVKAGAFGIIRVVYDVYGIELTQQLGVLFLLLCLASFTIIYGSVRAIYQDDIKKRLAFSTVSQVSYVTLGVALAGPYAAVGAIVHLVHQGLMKITMFFCAGNLAETHHIHKVSELDGIGQKMPFTMGAFTLAILGMIGIPPIAGFVSKWYLGVGAIQSNLFWLQCILIGSSVLNAIYFLPIVYRAWFKSPILDLEHIATAMPNQAEHLTDKKEAHWMMLLPPLVTITGATLAGLFAGSAFSPLKWAQYTAQEPQFGYELTIKEIAVSTAQLADTHLLILLIFAPFLIALFVAALRNVSIAKWLLPLCGLAAVVVSFILPPSTQVTDFLFFDSYLVIDNISQPFLFLAGVLWGVAALYANFYTGIKNAANQFYIFFALCMGGSFGVVLSTDIFGFITFFTIMSLSSYVLIISSLTDEARFAANRYIKWVIAGEVALFVAFTYIHGFRLSELSASNTSLQMILAVSLIIGFGIKIGLFGFHNWLPKAHPVAAIPASAMLSGFMVNAGIIGLLRFFPFDIGYNDIGFILIVLGISGTFYGALKGLFEVNPKAVLAYSTISQMGIVSSCIGAMIVIPSIQPAMATVIIFYCLHHGLAKSCLFLSVGLTPHLTINNWMKPLTWAVIILPALSLIGLPFLSGYFAKGEIKLLLSAYPAIKYVLLLSAVCTALLLLRFGHLMLNKAAEVKDNSVTSSPEPMLLIVTLINGIVMLSVPFIYAQSHLSGTDFTLFNMSLSILPLLIALMIYLYIQKKLPVTIAGTGKSISFNIIGEFIARMGTTINQKTIKKLEVKVRPFFKAYTSPNETTGETMQSIYVSFLIIIICTACFLALQV